jgi:hypothetical protein
MMFCTRSTRSGLSQVARMSMVFTFLVLLTACPDLLGNGDDESGQEAAEHPAVESLSAQAGRGQITRNMDRSGH